MGMCAQECGHRNVGMEKWFGCGDEKSMGRVGGWEWTQIFITPRTLLFQ